GTTEQNYKLSVEKSGTTGTANFQDLTAATGATRVNIGLGAADTAATVIFTNAGSQTIAGTLGLGSGAPTTAAAAGIQWGTDTADAPITASNLTTSGATIDNSAAPSISGCTATIGTGAKGTTGFYTSGTTGVCAVTLTFAYTAATGWVCATSDETTGNLSRQT